MKAYLILTAITFGELVLGLWLLGVRRFAGMAALISFLDLLPILGSGVVLLPWAGYCLLAGETAQGWGLVALWAVVSVVRQVLEPRVLGGQIGLSPLTALTAIYAGLRLGGVWGMAAAPVVCLMAASVCKGELGVEPKPECGEEESDNSGD